MNDRLHKEAESLARSWMQYEPEMLRDYLVSGVEDPRINIQSLLTRHFIINTLFGAQFADLIQRELQFGLVMNWLQAFFNRTSAAEDLPAVRNALERRADNAEGVSIPSYVRSAYEALPTDIDGFSLPNYLNDSLNPSSDDPALSGLREEVLCLFQRIWSSALVREASSDLSFLEPACGSANDFRFLHNYGLSRLIAYTGFDLCEKNVRNARNLFPNAAFRVGNVFAIEAEEHSFDYCVVHDLFEHLSLEGLEQALTEISRVTRSGLCFGFFNLHEGPEHFVQATDEYYWNKLSVPLLKRDLERRGFEVRVVHIDTYLKWRFGCADTHNKKAYTFFAHRS